MTQSEWIGFIALDLIFLAALLTILAGWPGFLVWLLYLCAWIHDFRHKDRP